MPKVITTEEFIRKAKLVHGDRYDYSQVVFKSAKLKVTIGCKEHGLFYQIPDSHLKGCGCSKCGVKRSHDKAKLTTEEFIRKARLKHGDRYDYSQSIYTQSDKVVLIRCKIHGPFYQTPDIHIFGATPSGCPHCGIERRSRKHTLTTEEFIKKANIIHNFKYDYSLVEYKHSHSKILIICKLHGEFEQVPTSHLNGSGCPDCRNTLLIRKFASNTQEFITKANKVHHNFKYDYSLVKYKNAYTKVSIICKLHGKFSQRPTSHLKGADCPECAK
ncbi:MAG: hypothetical protein ABSC08_19960 [Bryobacteraceae bacterium]|jgi:hypothetical protein